MRFATTFESHARREISRTDEQEIEFGSGNYVANIGRRIDLLERTNGKHFVKPRKRVETE